MNLNGLHPALIAIVQSASLETAMTVVTSVISVNEWAPPLSPAHVPMGTQIGTAGVYGHAVQLAGNAEAVFTAMKRAAMQFALGDQLNWGGVPDEWISDVGEFAPRATSDVTLFQLGSKIAEI